MIKFRIGPADPNEKEEKDDTPKSGWVAFWQSLASIIFILACLAYCTRNEIVEILK